MQVDYLFETPRGWDLMVGGPANHPKENAYPLSAIVETAWLPYPFAMNWQIMRPGRVVFEEDEPFCSIYPMQKNPIVSVEPQIRRLSENPALHKKAAAFRRERDEFHARMHAGDPEARKQAWNKQYFIGELSDGTRAVDHLTKLRLKAPVDKRQVQYGRRVSALPRDDNVDLDVRRSRRAPSRARKLRRRRALLEISHLRGQCAFEGRPCLAAPAIGVEQRKLRDKVAMARNA
jgi:Family of unknown function (DUF6065)